MPRLMRRAPRDGENVGLGGSSKDELGTGRRRRRIRCPRCGWEPARESLWRCECDHLWNTFETHGRCPACGKLWETTQCLRCKRWSPHEAWYLDEDEDEA